MADPTNREILLKRRPTGTPSPDDFDLVERPRPKPASGQILVRNIWMSVDPYMRGRMREAKSYTAPFQVGQPLEGGCVGQVVESQQKGFSVGDYVLGNLGWREYWMSDGQGVMRIDPKLAPIESFLGVLGMPGLTAYVGLLRIGGPREGETVFVSAASGAVGSLVCQIARIKGCHVVGSAGSPAKADWLRNEAGVDQAINYKEVDDLSEELRQACPSGIDIYFDNVGGDHLEAALANMNIFGRIVSCGMISQYNADSPQPGPRNLFLMIARRLRMQGFLVFDHDDMRRDFEREMSRWIAEGRIRWKETVVEGLENAPEAFIGLFQGENLGKMLVKVGPDPAV